MKKKEQKLYNEEQKITFLNTIENWNSRESFLSMFNRFEKYESSLDCDIAALEPNDVYNMICNLYTFDFGTLKQYVSMLNHYREYMSLNIEQLNAQDLDLTRAIQCAIIPSPSSLNMEIDKVLEPSQGHYMRAVICFAWLGIDVSIMPLIQNTAVDYATRSIHDNSCDLHISDIDDQIIQILKEYYNVREAIRGNGKAYPLYNGRFLRLMTGANSSKIPAPIKVASIHTEFYKIKDKYKDKLNKYCPLNYSDLLRSGGLYRLYRLEQIGVNIYSMDSDELLLATYSAPGKTYDIRSLYRQYKKAFNLE